MSFGEVDNFWTTTWSTEVLHVAQQEESLLSKAVYTESSPNSSTHKFHVMGKATTFIGRNRHQPLVPTDSGMEDVSVSMQDVYAVEWVDDLDQAKTNADVRGNMTKSIVMGLNRALDTQIINALSAATTTYNPGSFNNKLDLAAVTGIADTLNQNAVESVDRYLVVSAGGLKWMQQDTTLASRLFTGYGLNDRNSLIGDGEANTPLGGFKVIRMTDTSLLPSALSNTGHTCFAFQTRRVGLAVNKSPEYRVDYSQTYDAWQMLGKMSSNAVIIDPAGVIAVNILD